MCRIVISNTVPLYLSKTHCTFMGDSFISSVYFFHQLFIIIPILMEIVSNRGKFSRSLEKKDLAIQEKDNKLLSQKQLLKNPHSLYPSRQVEGPIPIYPAARSKSNDVAH
jgi:hypothetical protein